MQISTVGNVFVMAGAFVGVAAIAAVATDYSPPLSAEMVTLLFYKGLGAAAVGLMVVGTWIARSGRRSQRRPHDPDSPARPAQLGDADPRLLQGRPAGLEPHDAPEQGEIFEEGSAARSGAEGHHHVVRASRTVT